MALRLLRHDPGSNGAPKSGCKAAAFMAAATVFACLLSVSPSRAQGEAAAKPQTAEEVFKNVQVLRGISVGEFMGTMGFFAASLGMNCVDCHTNESVGNWANFADDTPRKQMTRKMVLMVRAINQGNFGGARRVTCYSCHRGSDRPEVSPSLDEQYGTPPPDDPDRVQIHGEPVQGAPVEQILDRYLQALGGAEPLARLTSYVAKGTYVGYDTDEEPVATDVFVKLPAQRTVIVHPVLGDDTTTFDGREGWVASIHEPLPLLPLTGGDLESARIDAELALPGRLKQDFTNWRGGFPDVTINGRSTQVIEGTTSGGMVVKLYFDKATGLLARETHSNNTIVGSIPEHVDYSDYRTVAGVKLPFHWVTTWTDGQSTTQLTDVQPNANIDVEKFGKPAPAHVAPSDAR